MTGPVRALVTGVLVVALAGCSTEDPPASGSSLPQRPLSVPADRVPPCAMLAPGQAQRLGLRRPTAAQGVVDDRPTQACTWLGSDGGLNVQFIPIGTEVAVAVPGSTITDVNGFGAVRNVPDLPGPPICQVAMDVAPGQTVRVQANAVPDPPYGMDELCRRAEEAASMVMTTVVAAAPR